MENRMKLVLGTMTFGQQVFEDEALEMMEYFMGHGYQEVDTAYVYNEGNSEKILGQIIHKMNRKDYLLATKVNPRITGRLDYDSIMSQFETSLSRMQVSSVDLLYLHFPDADTPVEDALRACDELYRNGKIKEFGVSNFSAEMVEDICKTCGNLGFISPTVYQGVYNALSRKSEGGLFEVLRKYGLRFYAYNPLAGGVLTGKYCDFGEKPKDGRFACRPNYQNRYWKKSYFEAVEIIRNACDEAGVNMTAGALRWLAFHSCMDSSRGDGIIVGVSKLQQLKDNMAAMEEGALPESVLKAFGQAWELCKEDAPEYYRFSNINK